MSRCTVVGGSTSFGSASKCSGCSHSPNVVSSFVSRVVAALAFLVSCTGSEPAPGGGAAETWTRIDAAELEDMLGNEDVFLVNVHVPYEGETPGTGLPIRPCRDS